MYRESNSQPSVGRLLSILHRMTQMYLQRELEPLGLGHGQVRVLRYVDNHPGTRQQEISEFFRLDKGSTSTLIRGLEEKGFLRKEKDMEDKRAYRLMVTQKTVELRPILAEIFSNWTTHLMRGFSGDEHEAVIYLMERMIKNADKEIK